MQKKIDTLCEGGHWFGKVPESVLDCYENFLDLTFPDDYRYFFGEYGSGSKRSVEIAGYDPIIISDTNIVAKTILKLRDYYYYPKHYLFFSDTGDGGQICFNRNNWQIFEVYKKMPNSLIENKIANTFYEFIEKKFN